MKQVLIIIVAMAVGAVAFWAFSPYILDTVTSEETDPTLEARLEAQRILDEARQNTESSEITEETVVETVQTTPEPPPSVAESYGIQNRGPFPIRGTTGHQASGAIEIIESPEEKLVYFKDYEGTAGPDLKVYLSRDLEASDVFELGDAQGTAGNLIYGVPLSIDVSDYKYVLTWSESEEIVFDYAKIN